MSAGGWLPAQCDSFWAYELAISKSHLRRKYKGWRLEFIGKPEESTLGVYSWFKFNAYKRPGGERSCQDTNSTKRSF